MRKSTFTEEQIAYALRQAESGTPVPEVCRKLGTSEQTFSRWKRKFAGMGSPSCAACGSWRRSIGA
jgi:putative transposase